jgi:hypothetical protein
MLKSQPRIVGNDKSSWGSLPWTPNQLRTNTAITELETAGIGRVRNVLKNLGAIIHTQMDDLETGLSWLCLVKFGQVLCSRWLNHQNSHLGIRVQVVCPIMTAP